MAMKHAHNFDKCNSFECYSPQNSNSVGKHLRTFSTWWTWWSSTPYDYQLVIHEIKRDCCKPEVVWLNSRSFCCLLSI